MQIVFRISMIVLILLIFQPVIPVSALEDGTPAGEVASINKKSKEIIINLADTGRGVKMGDRFYIRIDGDIVVMTATFPMMTTSKCRLEAKYSKYLNSIVKEMKVYRYKKGVDDKNNPAGRRTRNQKFGDLELIHLDGGVFVMGIPKEEWEYACRAGTITLFHYGDSLNSDMANFDGGLPYNSTSGIKRNKTMPVGSFSPNAFGLYDMHGNVAEWTWDWFNDGYYTVVENNVIIKSTARMTRGGSWNSNSTNLRSGRGYGWGPNSTSNELGIRVVRSVN